MSLFSILAAQSPSFWESLGKKITATFITEDRWRWWLKGLGVTLEVSLFAVLLGVIVGFILALMKLSHAPKCFARWTKPGKKPWNPLDTIATIYLGIVRGTPTVVQLLFAYLVVFAGASVSKVLVATLAFGLNSAAYVAEIFRAGILSIDKGQMEAGRSLGMTSSQTMRYVILPQAVKNVLPALGNEFIVLIKETAVMGYIAAEDITKVSDLIVAKTFDAIVPLVTTALTYLIIVLGLTKLLNLFERRMRAHDIRA
nr:amino acid ABC transporter permease [bacterium]